MKDFKSIELDLYSPDDNKAKSLIKREFIFLK